MQVPPTTLGILDRPVPFPNPHEDLLPGVEMLIVVHEGLVLQGAHAVNIHVSKGTALIAVTDYQEFRHLVMGTPDEDDATTDNTQG